MRKGDNKRLEILNAAEKLFCTKGYEATSVQDILDVLHASKGGFYHHFASKEELLKTLCIQRAEHAKTYTQELFASAEGDMERINAVLYGFMPLRRSEFPFLQMLLPVMTQPEGRAMSMIYQDALLSDFLPLLEAAVADAKAAGIVCPPVRGMEGPVLHLVNRCWLDVAELLIHFAGEGRHLDTSALLGLLERYRRSIEVLLDAPYGSIAIVWIEEWDEAASKILHALTSK